MKAEKVIQRLINFFENQPLSFGGWAVSFFVLLSLNLFFQFITYGFKNVTFEYFIGEIIQPYYFILYLAVVIFLYLITGEKIKKISSFALWGFWSIIFWPIIDKIILGNNFHLSFYIYDSLVGIFQKMITFFGPVTPVGILYGTRIETVFIMIFVGLYIYNKTKSVLRTGIGILGVYIIFYLSVALPSILVFMGTIFGGRDVMEITKLDIVKIFNTPLEYFGIMERGFAVVFFYKISLLYNLIFIGLLVWLQYLWSKNLLKQIVKNIRFPQMIFNWGMLLIGIMVGIYYWPNNFNVDFWSAIVLINLFLSVLFSWIFAVIINDIEDYEVDKISNKNRPLILGIIKKEKYLNYAWIFLFLSLLLGITINSKIFLLIALYNLLTFIYSMYPFKLKRIPWVAGVISSFSSLIIFLVGYVLISTSQTIKLIPWKIILFLFIAYALMLPIKDLKDIESDRENNILTVANLLGEKFARIYFGIVVFLLFLASVFVLAMYNLFWLAVVCGLIGFWWVNNGKVRENKLLYGLLFLVVIYLVGIAII